MVKILQLALFIIIKTHYYTDECENKRKYFFDCLNYFTAKFTNNISSTEFYNYFLRISNPVHCDINIDTDIDDIIQPNELDIMYEELNQPVTVDEVKKLN